MPRIDGNRCLSTAERIRRYHMRPLNRGCRGRRQLAENRSASATALGRECRGVAILAAAAGTTRCVERLTDRLRLIGGRLSDRTRLSGVHVACINFGSASAPYLTIGAEDRPQSRAGWSTRTDLPSQLTARKNASAAGRQSDL